MANEPRDHITYDFFNGDGSWRKCGSTNSGPRRQSEHRRGFGEPDGYIEQVGGKKTKTSARKWEDDHDCNARPGPKPRRPTPRSTTSRRSSRAVDPWAVVGGLATGALIGGAALGVGVLIAKIFEPRTGPSSLAQRRKRKP